MTQPLDLDAIEARANAVPSLVRNGWAYENCGHECCQWIATDTFGRESLTHPRDGHDPLNSRAALEHIASANPDTVLALVARIRELEARHE